MTELPIPVVADEEQMSDSINNAEVKYNYDAHVYALRCETFYRQNLTPSEVRHSARQLMLRQNEQRVCEGGKQEPVWLDHALECDALFYIGATNSPADRISAHVRGEGAWFTKLFKPSKLIQLDPFRCRHEAELVEKDRRARVNEVFMNRNLNRFAYSDLSDEEGTWQKRFKKLEVDPDKVY